jgi:toxin HigB-1
VLPGHADRIERILARLDEATLPEHMHLPGFRLHPLKGGLAGFSGVGVRQLAGDLSFRRDRRC